MTDLVALDEVSVRLGGRVALEPLTATWTSGSSIALVGPNGAGKTTLLRLVAGLLRPGGGSLRRPSGTTVGYVAQHQDQHRFLPLTVTEVLNMSRYGHRGLLGRLRVEDRRAVADAAHRLDVEDLASSSFGELSGGQRQRVLIAGAVATGAEVLLLDEPVTGLDPPSQTRILEVVRAERDAGRLVVLSTHDLDEAALCDRVVLLRAGRVIADGAPADVLVRDRLAEAFGSHVIDDGAGGVRVVDDHGHGSHP